MRSGVDNALSLSDVGSDADDPAVTGMPDVAAIGSVLIRFFAAAGHVMRVPVDRAVHEAVVAGQHAQVIVEVMRRTVEEYE